MSLYNVRTTAKSKIHTVCIRILKQVITVDVLRLYYMLPLLA